MKRKPLRALPLVVMLALACITISGAGSSASAQNNPAVGEPLSVDTYNRPMVPNDDYRTPRGGKGAVQTVPKYTPAPRMSFNLGRVIDRTAPQVYHLSEQTIDLGCCCDVTEYTLPGQTIFVPGATIKSGAAWSN